MKKEAEVCGRCGFVKESGQQCGACESDTVAPWG